MEVSFMKTSYNQYVSGATENDVQKALEITKKRFWIYILLSLIPVVHMVTIGMAIFCYNNIKYIKSHGRNQGSNIVRLILMLYGFIIVPIIVVQLAARIESLGNKILGWSKL